MWNNFSHTYLGTEALDDRSAEIPPGEKKMLISCLELSKKLQRMHSILKYLMVMKANPIWRLWPQKMCLHLTFNIQLTSIALVHIFIGWVKPVLGEQKRASQLSEAQGSRQHQLDGGGRPARTKMSGLDVKSCLLYFGKKYVYIESVAQGFCIKPWIWIVNFKVLTVLFFQSTTKTKWAVLQTDWWHFVQLGSSSTEKIQYVY